MKNVLRMELGKALKNKFFLITLAVGLLFATLSALYMIDSYHQINGTLSLIGSARGSLPDPELRGHSLFNNWIGGEAYSLGYTLFFFLIPLIATFPYGWSYFLENKRGYVKNVVIRADKKSYFLSKYIAVFVSGGLAVFIPLLYNFLLVALFVPAYTPDILYDLYYAILFGLRPMSELFYTQPFVYIGVYLVIDFLFSGLIAVFSLGLSYFIRNRFAVVLLPFFLFLGLYYLRDFFELEVAPVHFLHTIYVEYNVTLLVILIEGAALLAFTLLTTLWKGGKEDVF